MKRFLHMLAFLGVLAAGSIPVGAQANQATGTGFTLNVTPGPEYRVSKTFLVFFHVPIYPQVACWIETPDGKYVATVYATVGGARNRFLFAPRAGRPEVFPVWYHRRPAQPSALDAVSGATPTTAASHTARVQAPLDPGRYVAFLEINRSYDFNESYTPASSGVNGQPSVVYRAEIEVGRTPSQAGFKAVGFGSVDGSDGSIRQGLEGITTALHIIDSAEIAYKAE